MRLSVLASGSSGNATVIEANGTRLLIDCGISLRQLQQRMRSLAIEERFDAVLLTHEHIDHMRGLEVFLKRFPVPLLASAGTVRSLSAGVAEPLCPGRAIRIGNVEVLPVATSHDAAEPLGFVLEHGGLRVGLVTDTGYLPEPLFDPLRGCQALLLESNHDRDLLLYGTYPWPLKQRIKSDRGHLSNEQARAALERLVHPALEVVVGMHLSQENNTPDHATRELERVVAGGARLVLAHQERPVQVEVGSGRPRRGQLLLFEDDGAMIRAPETEPRSS